MFTHFFTPGRKGNLRSSLVRLKLNIYKLIRRINFLLLRFRAYPPAQATTKLMGHCFYNVGFNNSSFSLRSPDSNKSCFKSGLTKRYISNTKKNKNAKYKSRYYNYPFGMIIINFLRALFKNQLNLDHRKFKNYKEIIQFISKFEHTEGVKLGFKLTENYLAKLKSRGVHFEKVP
jgi:hypothetical protein